MKKLVTLILAAMLLLSCVYAEDLGVQVIGGPNVKNEPLSLDDMQIEAIYTIDGYAKVSPRLFSIVNHFGQFNKDADYNARRNDRRNSNSVYNHENALKGDYIDYYSNASWKDSGVNADFLWLQIDVTNLQKVDVKFMEDATVKVVYAEEYEFNGWVRQINFDHTAHVYRYGVDTTTAPYCVMDPANEEAIGMMYTGTYVFGCTVPNAVVEDKTSPLAVVITLGGNELTYHIRK